MAAARDAPAAGNEGDGDGHMELATASTPANFAAFDAIAISLMADEGFTKEEFLTNHPSGDVGQRLAEGRA